MFKLLFSADGRIDPQEFNKGAVVLLAINFILWLAWFTSVGLAMIAGMVALLSIYCWGCLFAKRFHDAGLNGLMFLPALTVFVILSAYVIPIILHPILPVSERAIELSNELAIINETIWDKVFSMSPEEAEKIRTMTSDLYRERALANAICFFISGCIVAFGTNRLLKTDPNPNQWG